jgi:hypothetical protein
MSVLNGVVRQKKKNLSPFLAEREVLVKKKKFTFDRLRRQRKAKETFHRDREKLNLTSSKR